MTNLVVTSVVPSLTVTFGRPNLTVSGSRIVASVQAENSVVLSMETGPLQLTASPENMVTLNAVSQPIILTVAGGGVPSSGPDVNDTLVGLRWGSPSGELSNTIEITGDILAYDGTVLLSSLPSVEIVVSDGAADAEPSHTAYLTAASSPNGVVLAGSGTATLIIQAQGGSLSVAVHEPGVGHRFLWVAGARHERLWIRAVDGVQELVFS